MKNQFIDIFGFEPTADETQFMKLKLDQVMAEAPSQATIAIKLHKKNGAFEGLANIFYSPGEPMEAIAKSQSLTEMVLELFQKLRIEIKSWKSQRFDLDTDKAVL